MAAETGAAADVRIEARDNDFILTRIFDAPREAVFKAWTDPGQFAQWWGPQGFTNPVCELDLRAGGAYRVTLRSPDGGEYPLKGKYLEIVAPEKLVMTMDTADHPLGWHELFRKVRGAENHGSPLKNVTTVTFEELGGRTRLTVTQRFDSIEDRDATLKMGAPKVWTQSFVRLDALLGRAS
jgi:uncharacterized protein YndB with AHSA1/START domain